MWRCINCKHTLCNSSQIQLFALSHCSLCFVAGVWGGGQSFQASLSWPPSTRVSKKKYFANSTYFKLSECEDVSNINMIQVKFSCFLCQIVLYACIGCRGGGQAVQASLSCPPPPHNSSQIQLYSLSHCSICLVAGEGGKLSRPVYLDPHPPEYLSKIILLILLF